jgi:hypothetical protein
MELYNSQLIPAAEDELWDSSIVIPAFQHEKMVVLSQPFGVNSAEAQTLEKMMAACKLSPQDYAVIQLKNDQRLSLQTLRTAGAPQKLLLLGIHPQQFGIQALLPLNTCQSFGEGLIIVGSSLSEIVAQPALKRAIWEQGLKPCFGL